MIEKLGITPGPWETRQDNNTGIPYVFAHGRIFEDTSQPRTGMGIENGLLIAAAPDMLEALIGHAAANEEWRPVWAIKLIEIATGKTWEEVKTILESEK